MNPATLAGVQRRLGLPPTGTGDVSREVRAFQRERGLTVSGALDEPTLRTLDNLPTAGLVPGWFGTETADAAVGARLGGCDRDTILRFQSAVRLPLTGVVDEPTAIKIGD